MQIDIASAATRTRRAPIGELLAGAGGLVFVALLIVQNAIRSSAPSFGAAPGDVTAYFAAHHAAAIVPLALFPFGMAALLAFAAGVWHRVHDGAEARWWGDVGALAVVVLAGLFGVVNVVEIVITAAGSHLATAPEVVRALWTLHAAAFGLNLAAIAIALVALSRAALAAGLVPRAIALLALPGAVCLFLAAIFTVSIAEGGQWIDPGYVGFVIWGIFVVTAGVALLRGRPYGASGNLARRR